MLLVTPMIVRSIVYCRQKIGFTFDSVRTEHELNEELYCLIQQLNSFLENLCFPFSTK